MNMIPHELHTISDNGDFTSPRRIPESRWLMINDLGIVCCISLEFDFDCTQQFLTSNGRTVHHVICIHL